MRRRRSTVTPANQISNIRGYMELGMLDDAGRELYEFPPEHIFSLEYAVVTVDYFEAMKDWPTVKSMAETYARNFSGHAHWQRAIDRAIAAINKNKSDGSQKS